MINNEIKNKFVCTISIYLAYIALVYILASIFYLIFTRKIGTPFMDAVNENYPELLEIKKESSKKRRNIFMAGIAINIVIAVLIRPFKKCIN